MKRFFVWLLSLIFRRKKKQDKNSEDLYPMW